MIDTRQQRTVLPAHAGWRAVLWNEEYNADEGSTRIVVVERPILGWIVTLTVEEEEITPIILDETAYRGVLDTPTVAEAPSVLGFLSPQETLADLGEARWQAYATDALAFVQRRRDNEVKRA